jgi:hypothetical protein
LLTTISLAAAADVEFFESRCPVLAKNCYPCHAATKEFSGLRVDSREALKGGKRGTALMLTPMESLLVCATGTSGVAAMPMAAS